MNLIEFPTHLEIREYGNEKMASGLRTMFGTNQSPDRLSLIFIRKSSGV